MKQKIGSCGFFSRSFILERGVGLTKF